MFSNAKNIDLNCTKMISWSLERNKGKNNLELKAQKEYIFHVSLHFSFPNAKFVQVVKIIMICFHSDIKRCFLGLIVRGPDPDTGVLVESGSEGFCRIRIRFSIFGRFRIWSEHQDAVLIEVYNTVLICQLY